MENKSTGTGSKFMAYVSLIIGGMFCLISGRDIIHSLLSKRDPEYGVVVIMVVIGGFLIRFGVRRLQQRWKTTLGTLFVVFGFIFIMNEIGRPSVFGIASTISGILSLISGLALIVSAFMDKKVTRKIAETLDTARQKYSKRSIEELILDLNNPDWSIRASSLRALREKKDPSSLEAIIQLLNDSDADIVTEASLTLKELTGQDFGKDVSSWLNWLQTANSRS